MQAISKSQDQELKSEYRVVGGDKCIQKIKYALELIMREIKEVNSAIEDLTVKKFYHHDPKLPDNHKGIKKSVKRNSSTCYEIVCVLKKQKKEINKMLDLYEETTRDFTKLETVLNQQREKVEQMNALLNSITDTVRNVKHDINERHKNFLLELKSRSKRTEKQEEILDEFLNWMSMLETKRLEEEAASDLRLKEAIAQREKDRTVLILAVRQIEEIKKIDMQISRDTNLKGTIDKSNESIKAVKRLPRPICECRIANNKVVVISDQFTEVKSDGALKINVDPALRRRPEDANKVSAPITIETNPKNVINVWESGTSDGYHKKVFQLREHVMPLIRHETSND